MNAVATYASSERHKNFTTPANVRYEKKISPYTMTAAKTTSQSACGPGAINCITAAMPE